MGSGASALKAFAQGVEEWKLLVAVALAGLANESVKLAAAYASQRKQFGQFIGTFQAISHPLADRLGDADGGNSDLYVEKDLKEQVGGNHHFKVDGDRSEKVAGHLSMTAGRMDTKIDMAAAIEVGQLLHIKGMAICIEADTQLSLKVGGNFVDISLAGVAINGMPMTLINSGGAAGATSAAGSSSGDPVTGGAAGSGVVGTAGASSAGASGGPSGVGGALASGGMNSAGAATSSAGNSATSDSAKDESSCSVGRAASGKNSGAIAALLLLGAALLRRRATT